MSYLSYCIASLYFDRKSTLIYRIYTRVLQGSSLLLILFLLYTTSLYKELGDYRGIVAISFSDNLNLLTIGRNIQEIYYYLEVV